ncbi:hypothetical protein C8Q77DRAFT_307434 [Trametes polyzona]|nr:hypothetical protein C8Q77DRAFT_307434 [Trametes polyzona]
MCTLCVEVGLKPAGLEAPETSSPPPCSPVRLYSSAASTTYNGVAPHHSHTRSPINVLPASPSVYIVEDPPPPLLLHASYVRRTNTGGCLAPELGSSVAEIWRGNTGSGWRQIRSTKFNVAEIGACHMELQAHGRGAIFPRPIFVAR